MRQLKLLFILTGTLFLLTVSCKDDPAPLAVADFYVDGDGCASSCKVLFFDQSLNAVKWQWTFGNGITSNNQHDSTTYTSNNIYSVQLIVWNSDDVGDTISKYVTIY